MAIKRPRSLTALVVDELRARIIDGRLRLGELVSENALAAELGISKTPVREALLELKLDRLVDVLPQRGTYVFRLGPADVVNVSKLREMLEVKSAAIAMKRNGRELALRMASVLHDMRKAYHAGDIVAYRTLDGSYHRTLIEACGNSYIADAYAPIDLRIQALRSRLSDEEALNRLSFRDHCNMLKLTDQGRRGHGPAEAAARPRPADSALLYRGSRPARDGGQSAAIAWAGSSAEPAAAG